MKTPRTIQVLADPDGGIVGVAILDDEESSDPEAQVRVSPLNGQRLAEVRVPEGIKRLESLEDFQRLSEAFYLPTGESELARRGDGRKVPKAPAKAKAAGAKGKPAAAKRSAGSKTGTKA